MKSMCCIIVISLHTYQSSSYNNNNLLIKILCPKGGILNRKILKSKLFFYGALSGKK